MYTLTLIVSTSARTQYLLLCLYWIRMLSIIWIVWALILHVLCLSRIQWWRGMRGQTTHVLLPACYIQYVMWYVCTVLMCYSQVSCKTSQVTLLAHICNVKLRSNCTVAWIINHRHTIVVIIPCSLLPLQIWRRILTQFFVRISREHYHPARKAH